MIKKLVATAYLNFFIVVTVGRQKKYTLHCQFVLPLHTAESISNVHFILNKTATQDRNKGNGESETWTKWLTKGALVCFCTVCVVRTLHGLWRCAWCLCIEFILFLCKSELWTFVTWQWKWNTTFSDLDTSFSTCTCVPNFVSWSPPREEITSELHHNYIIISQFGGSVKH